MTETLVAALAALQFQLTPVHDYKLSGKSETKNATTFVAQDGEITLKGTVSEFKDESAAKQAKKEKIGQIRALYDGHPEQYFAMITRKTECPKEFQLHAGTSGKVEWLSMFANERNVLGACATDIATKRAQTVFLICGSKLLELTKFIPRDQRDQGEENELTSITCL